MGLGLNSLQLLLAVVTITANFAVFRAHADPLQGILAIPVLLIAVKLVSPFSLPIGTLALGQYRAAWLTVGAVLLASVINSHVHLISGSDVPALRWLALPFLLGGPLLWLVGVYLLFACPLKWPIYEPAPAPAPNRRAVLLAVLFGPTGLAQAAQGQWAKAYLWLLPTTYLDCLFGVPSDLITGARSPQEQVLVACFIAILWLAAIWDAWDTQRKAGQEQPAGEGSPSPA
jgi:hypothetical protein